MLTQAVADPEFLGSGAPTPKVDVKSYYLAISPLPTKKNCMKLKQFGPWGGHVPGDLPMPGARQKC